VAFQEVFSGRHTDCILAFSLGLSVQTLRRFCRLRTMIWYVYMICSIFCSTLTFVVVATLS